MMKLSIAKCFFCKRKRLVDKSKGKNVCFSCKQKVKL
jgi:hypothetical protein